jgi:hypothetical protein
MRAKAEAHSPFPWGCPLSFIEAPHNSLRPLHTKLIPPTCVEGADGTRIEFRGGLFVKKAARELPVFVRSGSG